MASEAKDKVNPLALQAIEKLKSLAKKLFLLVQAKHRHLKVTVLFCLAAIFLGIVVNLVLEVYGARTWYKTPGPNVETRSLVIPQASLRGVAKILQENNLISSGFISRDRFLISAWVTSNDGFIRAGELTFGEHATPQEILLTLRHGALKKHNITIPEGLTAAAITKILNSNEQMTGTFPEITEGSIFPSTYSYFSGEDRLSIVLASQKEMAKKLQAAWDSRDVQTLSGYIDTPEQLLTLASIVERESVGTQERPMIAGVFLRRLKKGMKLQTDPTILYALSLEGKFPGTLSHQDMSINSPYNTYIYAGLPPGPICSPGEKALNATAHPVDKGYLYFVANKKGAHEFSRTYVEHQSRIRRIFHHGR